MNKVVQIQELAVVVVARNHNPTILNPDFLKYNSIVPTNWELASPPICAAPIAQVSYNNGISIVARFDKLIFSQNLDDKNLDEVQVPTMMIKYIETLPHVDYRAVGINTKGHVVADSEEEVQRYLLEKFIAQGPWKAFRDKQATVSLSLSYPIQQGSLNLSVEYALLSLADEKRLPVVIFACNTHRDIKSESSKDKIDELKKIIQSWKTDVETYRSLVERNFLNSEA